ncbi:MAG: hypothetical protein MUP98_11015, partial [Candidatus Aminicenantes bacterium]|nr:hypothetical protein [Candidatus Aminicenantes bacterium]
KNLIKESLNEEYIRKSEERKMIIHSLKRKFLEIKGSFLDILMPFSLVFGCIFSKPLLLNNRRRG